MAAAKSVVKAAAPEPSDRIAELGRIRLEVRKIVDDVANEPPATPRELALSQCLLQLVRVVDMLAIELQRRIER